MASSSSGSNWPPPAGPPAPLPTSPVEDSTIEYHQVVQFSSGEENQMEAREDEEGYHEPDSSDVPTEEEEDPTPAVVTSPTSPYIPSRRSSSTSGLVTSGGSGYYLTAATGHSPHPPGEQLMASMFPDVISAIGDARQSEDSTGSRQGVPEEASDVESWRDYSNDLLAGKSIFFGHRTSVNVMLVIGGGSKPTTLHAHWEVLCSSFSYFENMKDCRMRESVEGVAYFPTDSPRAWLTQLKRVYPPYRQLDFTDAVEVISLVDRLQASWLSRELQGVLSDESYGDQRTPAIADMLAAHGLSDVVASWFNEKYWPALNAWRCVSECKNVQALRCAALLGDAPTHNLPAVDWRVQTSVWSHFAFVLGKFVREIKALEYVCHEAASTKSQVEQLRKTLRDAKMESRGRQNRISRMKSAGEIFYS
ncbi:hypothetical protein FOL46_005983 [Perkinsus olseni]|uniref:BTB domain-containing protein n=1 Tax=Perkinsus olseni TaxID=32597 RepID=A0A7J6LND6_PEROL|nr:hypothetical protein FOL46_005983 [Perkinsus olseni]